MIASLSVFMSVVASIGALVVMALNATVIRALTAFPEDLGSA